MPNPGVRERRRPPMIRRFGSDAPIKFRLFQDYCATDAGLLTFEVLLGTAEQSAQRAGTKWIIVTITATMIAAINPAA